MKFALSGLVLSGLLILDYLYGVSSLKKKHPSNKKRVISKEHNNQSALIVTSITDSPLLITPTPPVLLSVKPNTGKVFRRRRRRKHRRLSTTTPPSTGISTYVAKEGTNKKRKKNGIRKQKQLSLEIPKEPWIVMESENLVLPITPLETTTIAFISTSSSTKKKRTRCSHNNGGCSHICNSRGAKKCSCFRGFFLDSDGKNCLDIDECHFNNGGCQMNCSNTVGSYYCQCLAGFRLSTNGTTCEDINECLVRNGHGPCQDVCVNTYGGYNCSCSRLKGTLLAEDLHGCVDVDECAKENGGCSHVCVNTFGRHFCSCPLGLELGDDFKTCEDIDKCRNELPKNGCANSTDLQDDAPFKPVTTYCPPLQSPPHGNYKCSRKVELKKKQYDIGTKCFLRCPKGFKKTGKGRQMVCGPNGLWEGNGGASKCIERRKKLNMTYF